MLLENVATIRTGVVTTRKKAGENDPITYEYKLLNLKCASKRQDLARAQADASAIL